MKHPKSPISSALAVSYGSIAVNLLLAVGKLIAGLAGHSRSMVADAVHSASDVASTIIVIIALMVSGKAADKNHEYGHDKFENLASAVLSLLLFWTGMRIGWDGVTSILSKSYLSASLPTFAALWAAVISILVKELMYQITIRVAKREHSSALAADAWHHRSDALSSVGSLAGIGLSMAGFPVMDAVASLVICIFIFKAALDILTGALGNLTDESCGEETEAALRECALSVEGVLRIDSLRTRQFGNGFYVDLEIAADSGLSLTEAHRIAEQVHDLLEHRFPDIRHCMVHVNPA